MPRDGGTPLARFAHAIAAEDGLSVGTASLSDDGSTVTVPILRTRGPARRYVLAQEVSDGVSAVDPGRLDRLRVRNASRSRVFLAPGTLFTGQETPSRGTVAGVLLEPGSEADVEVKCVHASQALTARAILPLAASIAPDEVRRALLSRDQGLVWATVGETVRAHPPLPSARPIRKPRPQDSDDLLGVVPISPPTGTGHDSAPRAASSEAGQCGVAILDADGVRGFEVYDSPESWSVAATLAPTHRADGDDSAAISAMTLALDPKRAIEVTKQFLGQIGQGEYRRVTPSSWSGVERPIEYTEFDGEILHLIAFGGAGPRVDGSAGSRNTSRAGWSVQVEPSGLGPGSFAMGSVSRAGDGDVAAIATSAADPEELLEQDRPEGRPRRRKVLTSGWDASTLDSLERYSGKEFGGDRSAAMRFLVRQGLDRRGYLGPRLRRQAPAVVSSIQPEEPTPHAELGRAAMETRIRDFERIAGTEAYAEWLRVRAHLELERLASADGDEFLRASAQTALDRLPAPPREPESSLPVEEEAPPLPPPVDVRPLLRRAFSASAGGRYSEALVLFDEVLDAEPDNRTALLGRAVALRRSGKALEALAALDQVLRLEPANAAALLNRGRALQDRGDLAGALETFDRLATVAPNDWDVWMARGDVLTRMGEDRAALGAYSEALRRNPDDESIKAKIRTLERTRQTPAPSAPPSASLPRDVQEGQSFLVKEGRPDLSYRVLRTLATRRVPSLVITHRPAATVRAEQGLGGTRILELGHAPGEGRISPTSLILLTSTIERFVEENHGRAVILLDGVGVLVAENGFRDSVLFVERVHEVILQSQAVFLISLAPGDLGDKEAAILERNLRVLA